MPESVTVLSRSEKSAKVVVAGESQRRTEREGVILVKVMCWKWHQMSALAERSSGDEVKPSLTWVAMKTDARTLIQGTWGIPQLLEPPGADPHAGGCGRGERETAPPIPINSDI
jgi:hypothetical protein